MKKAKRKRFYPRNHREKYAGHEFIQVCGIAVRRLSEREILEFREVISSGPLRPIRLDVNA